MSEPSPAEHREELMLLYQVTVGDLTYFKTQQWAVTNYAFLLLAAVVGLHQVLKTTSALEQFLLIVLALAIGLVTLVVLHKLQTSVRVRQSRLEATRKSFSAAFNEAWAAEIKGLELIHSIMFLRAAVAIGTLIVCWLVVRAPV
jgi:hypothetical protein